MAKNEWDFESYTEAPQTETGFAQGRLPDRLYTSRTFANRNQFSSDIGQPSRFAYEVFDDDGLATKLTRDGEEWMVTSVEGSRTQVKVLVSREAGALVDLWIQKVPAPGSSGMVRDVLRLRRDDAIRLMHFMQHLELIEPDGADTGTRLDDAMVAELLNQPGSAEVLYGQHGQILRTLIENDAQAKDVIALAGRRATLDDFRRLLSDDEYFDEQIQPGQGPEAVWQNFFEGNPWLLGAGLGTQLLTSWSPTRLEQVVAGHAVDRVGKRTDAFLRTTGIVKSIVFAEIKHHRTPLLRSDEYRAGVWGASAELSGGTAQIQVTVHRAVADIGQKLQERDSRGFEVDEGVSYLVRPKSFLVVGQLAEFVNEHGAHHPDKIGSPDSSVG